MSPSISVRDSLPNCQSRDLDHYTKRTAAEQAKHIYIREGLVSYDANYHVIHLHSIPWRGLFDVTSETESFELYALGFTPKELDLFTLFSKLCRNGTSNLQSTCSNFYRPRHLNSERLNLFHYSQAAGNLPVLLWQLGYIKDWSALRNTISSCQTFKLASSPSLSMIEVSNLLMLGRERSLLQPL